MEYFDVVRFSLSIFFLCWTNFYGLCTFLPSLFNCHGSLPFISLSYCPLSLHLWPLYPSTVDRGLLFGRFFSGFLTSISRIKLPPAHQTWPADSNCFALRYFPMFGFLYNFSKFSFFLLSYVSVYFPQN